MFLWGPDGDGFLAYARTQHDLGVEVAAQHISEETGCCRVCGRPYPCEEQTQALRLSEHYRSWVAEPPH